MHALREHGTQLLLALALLALAPGLALATSYNIHVGGVCSTSYTTGKGAARSVGSWGGEVSISAPVDQRDSVATATVDLKNVLDQYCLGQDWCTVYTYSNGGAIISRALAIYSTPWRIDVVYPSASNEGGTELAGTGWLGSLLNGCGLAGTTTLLPSSQRSGWNHNDTHGVPFYMLAGHGLTWYTFGATSLLLPGDDDSLISFHSAGGFSSVVGTYDLCSGNKWSNHFMFSCQADGADHMTMSKRIVCLTGGGC